MIGMRKDAENCQKLRSAATRRSLPESRNDRNCLPGDLQRVSPSGCTLEDLCKMSKHDPSSLFIVCGMGSAGWLVCRAGALTFCMEPLFGKWRNVYRFANCCNNLLSPWSLSRVPNGSSASLHFTMMDQSSHLFEDCSCHRTWPLFHLSKTLLSHWRLAQS
ncbi:hypothetical protein BV22DRAFT_147800 [Leucogyrophana mollusca]|uniref:Uncharacterized protein n=1 Tax=Leucogyrophana mollusca TaxID=85980 RepID=A0ACB8BUW9_9AGAM|nr:hypothetical protein BV22DRAFT_147800 [Leucogyrophana mollusca]